MKKILFGFIAMLSFNAATMAQAVKKAAAKTTDTKLAVVAAKPTTPAKVVSITKPAVAVTKPAVAVTKPGVVLKKDGTPDKRYNAAATAAPVKKDGTPDMRYKSNKKTN